MNVIQDRINKVRLKFLREKEAIVIGEDPFPPLASIKNVAFDFDDIDRFGEGERNSTKPQDKKCMDS